VTFLPRVFYGFFEEVFGEFWGIPWGVCEDFWADLFVQKWGFFGVIPLDFVGDFVGRTKTTQ